MKKLIVSIVNTRGKVHLKDKKDHMEATGGDSAVRSNLKPVELDVDCPFLGRDLSYDLELLRTVSQGTVRERQNIKAAKEGRRKER